MSHCSEFSPKTRPLPPSPILQWGQGEASTFSEERTAGYQRAVMTLEMTNHEPSHGSLLQPITSQAVPTNHVPGMWGKDSRGVRLAVLTP